MALLTRDLGLHGSVDVSEVFRAVRAEQRRARKSVQLRAVNVEDRGDGIYEVTVSGFPTLDWSWEGSRAFRLATMESPEEGQSERVWHGDVVGVAVDESALFVSLDAHSSAPPKVGSFIVTPFDYLSALMAILRNPEFAEDQPDLGAALRNTIHPDPGKCREVGWDDLPVPEDFWDCSWSVLWGPPGTGKTFTIGELVGAVAGEGERVLVVSTTNKATDTAALEIGRHLRNRSRRPGAAVRLGSGADYSRFEREGFVNLVEGTGADLRRKAASLKAQLRTAVTSIEAARLQKALTNIQKQLASASGLFTDRSKDVVICTAHGALSRLVSGRRMNEAASRAVPFTTVILDEAGLLSRAVTAALSLLAAHRVVLVGDPRQLAPISRMSRVLPPDQARWLGESGLSSIDEASTNRSNVKQLTRQYRMAPRIRQVVSDYHYDGRLTDAPEVVLRSNRAGTGTGLPSRAIWYVLDDDAGENLAHIRGVRGAGNRSWERHRSWEVLSKLLKGHPEMASATGLFIAPFAAQARLVRRRLAEVGYTNWTSSTVHAQQGAEADFVVFDTVHAGSTGWPSDEWRRLVVTTRDVVHELGEAELGGDSADAPVSAMAVVEAEEDGQSGGTGA